MNHRTTNQSLQNILADLVAFRTVTGNYEQAAELLSYVRAQTNGNMHESDFVSHDFPSLILSTQKTTRPKVTLQAHIDVVPGDDGQFRLVHDGDKLYGRGVYDMKFALACYIKLVQELGPRLNTYDFALMLTSDEEVGGAHGVKALIDHGYQTDVCILPDGGDNWQIEERAKGTWHVALHAEGLAAHGSRPWEGNNAAAKLVSALHAIQTLNTDKPNDTTVAITQIQSGKSVNQIPESALATLDIRFMTMQAYESIHHQLATLAKQHHCQLETLLLLEPIQHSIKDPFIDDFITTAKQTLGQHLVSTLSFGATDGRYFVAQGTPVIVIRPVGGGQHSADEWISQQSLETFYQILKQYIQTAA